MKTNLLISEPPLQVLPSLARIVGLNEAIILQQVQYWLSVSGNERDGRLWVYNTYEDWHKQFPFWSVHTIRRAIAELERLGLLLTANYNKLKIDQTKWYTINYDALEHAAHPDQFGHIQGLKLANADGQNGHMDSTKVSTPLPETTTETTTETTRNYSDEDIRLVGLFFELMLENNPGMRRKPVQRDYNIMRLLREKDERDPRLVEAIIRWSQQHSFWHTNILSVSKLREQFDRLLVQAKTEHDKNAGMVVRV